jgi:hypothetical protein
LLCSSSCTFLSNRNYVERYGSYRGIKNVGIFLQRWPAYLQTTNQNEPGMDFIRKTTLFTGPWEPAAQINPRAIDIQDIDDCLMGEILVNALKGKGYQPFLLGVMATSSSPITVEEIMAKSQAINPDMDALLFCFYSPTVYFSKAQATPKDHDRRSYGLQEIVELLNPGSGWVIWAGPRAAQAPDASIDHAFIYVSLTMFRTLDWRPLWEVADSQVGGRPRPKLSSCPPAPTDQNYWADAAMIQRLMCSNLSCRLSHLIPEAF